MVSSLPRLITARRTALAACTALRLRSISFLSKGRVGDERKRICIREDVRGLYLFLLKATGRAGLPCYFDLIGAAREKIFLQFWIQHLQFQKISPELFRNRGERALRFFDTQCDSLSLQGHIEILLAETQILLWLRIDLLGRNDSRHVPHGFPRTVHLPIISDLLLLEQ